MIMQPIILASASAIRLALLRNAGVSLTAESASIDESAVKLAFRAQDGSAEACAMELAHIKAKHVSLRHPAALVIGADQMLDCGGLWYDKPQTLDQARTHLRTLRGKHHRLVTAVIVLCAGEQRWRTVVTATLSMRALSDGFIEDYLSQIGDAAFATPGAYQLEERGAQLFDRVEGDFFTILGLPLLPLLGFLRGQGVLAT
ncbi:MAG: Maf family protein [Aliidongia sp.]